MADQSYFGQQGLTDGNSAYNHDEFQGRQQGKDMRTGIPVKIIAVHGGGVGPAPTVDVQPLVTQQDGQGNQTPHGIIYGIPTTRNQGGGNAIINDPKVGDIGYAHVADRDISALKANAGKQSQPGSFRTHSLSDMVYQGAFLNPANPTQYIQWTDNGFKVMTSGGCAFEMVGTTMTITGDLHVSGDVVAGAGGGDSVSLQNHLTTLVVPGGGISGPPEAGT